MPTWWWKETYDIEELRKKRGIFYKEKD